MGESTDVSSDEFNQKAIDAFNKAGIIPMEAVVYLCEFMGRELQGVPSQYRKLSIARLRNKAKLLESMGFPYQSTEVIEALCRGWEKFD